MSKIYLALNAAEKRIQLIIGNEQEMLYGQDYVPQKNGTDTLFYFLQMACEQINIEPANINYLATVAGPGNFMGIRITALIASSLARTGDLPKFQAPINYLHCLASNVPASEGEIVKVVTPATKKSLHLADYRFEHGKALQITPLRLIQLDEIGAQNYCSPNYIVGSGLALHKEVFEKNYPKSILLPESFNSPSLNTLYQLASDAQYTEKDVDPIYLKQCDALENLNSIAIQQGQSPEQAHAQLQKLMTIKDF